MCTQILLHQTRLFRSDTRLPYGITDLFLQLNRLENNSIEIVEEPLPMRSIQGFGNEPLLSQSTDEYKIHSLALCRTEGPHFERCPKVDHCEPNTYCIGYQTRRYEPGTNLHNFDIIEPVQQSSLIKTYYLYFNTSYAD